jgi:hypothetical protein
MEVFDGGNAKSPLEQVNSNLCAKKTPWATARKVVAFKKNSTGSL